MPRQAAQAAPWPASEQRRASFPALTPRPCRYCRDMASLPSYGNTTAFDFRLGLTWRDQYHCQEAFQIATPSTRLHFRVEIERNAICHALFTPHTAGAQHHPFDDGSASLSPQAAPLHARLPAIIDFTDFAARQLTKRHTYDRAIASAAFHAQRHSRRHLSPPTAPAAIDTLLYFDAADILQKASQRATQAAARHDRYRPIELDEADSFRRAIMMPTSPHARQTARFSADERVSVLHA